MRVRILVLLLAVLGTAGAQQHRRGSPQGRSPGPPPSQGRSPNGQSPSSGLSPYGQSPGQPPSPGRSPYGQPASPPGQSPYGQPASPPGQSRYGPPSPSPGQPPSQYGQPAAPGQPSQYGQAQSPGQNQYRQMGGPPQAPSPQWASHNHMHQGPPPENIEEEMVQVRNEVLDIEREVHEVADMVNRVEHEIGAARQEALVGHKQAEELAEILAESAAADELNKSNIISVSSILAIFLALLLYAFNGRYAN